MGCNCMYSKMCEELGDSKTFFIIIFIVSNLQFYYKFIDTVSLCKKKNNSYVKNYCKLIPQIAFKLNLQVDQKKFELIFFES